MPLRLRPAPRRRPRTNPRAELSSLSRTSYRDRPAYHFRLSVPRLVRLLSPLFRKPRSRAGYLFRYPQRHCRTASARRAVPCRARRFAPAPLRSAYPRSRMAPRSARPSFPNQLRARPAVPSGVRRHAGQRRLLRAAELPPSRSSISSEPKSGAAVSASRVSPASHPT